MVKSKQEKVWDEIAPLWNKYKIERGIKRLGGNIIGCAVIIELEDLGGRKKLEDKGYGLFSIVRFKGE